MNIVQIFGSEKREFEKFRQINEEHKQAYDLALLSQNMLTGEELTNFIKRSVDLVS